MQYSGLYRCSGCSVTFSDPVAWREGATERQEPSTDVTTSAQLEAGQPSSDQTMLRPSGHSFATWGLAMQLPTGEPLPYGYGEGGHQGDQRGGCEGQQVEGATEMTQAVALR